VHFVDDPAFEGGIGREVTAADVVYSLQRHFDPAMRPQGTWLWQGRIVGLDEWKTAGSGLRPQPVERPQALDRHTLRIQLTQPYPQLLDTLAQGYSAVVPREAVERYGREFAVRPVGSGRSGSCPTTPARILMERNPKFRQEPVDLAAEGYNPSHPGQRTASSASPAVRRPSSTGSTLLHQRVLGTLELVHQGRRGPVHDRPERAARPRAGLAQARELAAGVRGALSHVCGREAGFIFSAFNIKLSRVRLQPGPGARTAQQSAALRDSQGLRLGRAQRELLRRHRRDFPGIIVPAVPEFDPDMSRDSVTRDVPRPQSSYCRAWLDGREPAGARPTARRQASSAGSCSSSSAPG
jgi:oligopeptide transport system substrate-binding protein